MILNGSSNKAKNGKVFLCSHGTLRSFGDRYGWDKISQLFRELGIGMKFYDEELINAFDTWIAGGTPPAEFYRATSYYRDFENNNLFSSSIY